MNRTINPPGTGNTAVRFDGTRSTVTAVDWANETVVICTDDAVSTVSFERWNRDYSPITVHASVESERLGEFIGERIWAFPDKRGYEPNHYELIGFEETHHPVYGDRELYALIDLDGTPHRHRLADVTQLANMPVQQCTKRTVGKFFVWELKSREFARETNTAGFDQFVLF